MTSHLKLNSSEAPVHGASIETQLECLLRQAAEETWVTEERRRIAQARTIKSAWETTLGMPDREQMSLDVLRRVCLFGALVDRQTRL